MNLRDGPSHVRKSIRIIWQRFNILRHAVQLLNLAYQCKTCFVGSHSLTVFLLGELLLHEWKKTHLSPKWQPSFVLCLTHSGGKGLWIRANFFQTAAASNQMDCIPSRFRLLKRLFPPLALGDRGPGDGERVLSHSPLYLTFLLISCLKLHESPLRHFPLVRHRLQSSSTT